MVTAWAMQLGIPMLMLPVSRYMSRNPQVDGLSSARELMQGRDAMHAFRLRRTEEGER